MLGRLSRRLEAEGGLSCFWARWSIECWALALDAVEESERLMVVQLGRLTPLLEQAVTNGLLPDGDLDRLVAEAERRGLRQAEARAFFEYYATSRGWPQLGAVVAEPG